MATKTPTKPKPKKATKTPTKKGLSVSQELFLSLYVKNDELRNNATMAWAVAHNIDIDSLSDEDAVYERQDEDGNGRGKIIEPSTRAKAINVCAAASSRLLRTVKAQDRKIELLNELLDDRIVDSQLSYWIKNTKEPAASIAGIREYNKLKQRIVDKVDVTSKGESIKGIEYVVPEPPHNETETGTDV